MVERPDVEIHHAGEWAALYVNGGLALFADLPAVQRRALELAGVTVVFDGAFLRGHDPAGVAKTLAEVAVYRRTRSDTESRHRQEEPR